MQRQTATPLPPTNVFSRITFSDTEDAPATASEASINIHSQDEDSIDYNATSPPRTYHIPMSPCKPMLTRPPYITATNTQEESDLPVSDTETESSYTPQTENTNFSSLQDHATYITRPSACSQPISNTEELYTSTHLTVGSIELHKQSITMLEDEITSTPTRTCPIPLPRPSKATHVKQISTNQRKQPTHDHPEPTLVQKSPLLPTPPASQRISNNTNNYKQHTARPSTFNSRKSTYTRPSEFNNYKFHQQHHIPRPHTPRFNNQRPPLLPRPSCQHQNFITRPYPQHQQPQGHCTQQPYVPNLILTPYNQLNNVLAHQTNLFNPQQC